MYPDQSLYPANSVPQVVRRINQTLERADQIAHSEGKDDFDWFAPIIADGEAGFGGPLNVYEMMKAMIEAGASGVHFEDQLASEKKCGHMGGKVLIPTQSAVKHLVSARLAADVMGVPTLLLARTDANGATLITSDIDATDHKFLTGERTAEGFYRMRNGLNTAIARGLSYAPYADLLWCETAEPNVEEARRFADAIHAEFPGKLLAYNCSPSFNWQKKLNTQTIAESSSRLSPKWDMSSSSSPWLASMPSITACSSWRLAIRIVAWPLIPNYNKASSPLKNSATPPLSTSVKSAPATSMRLPR
jgi:isocitrate lyase